MNPCRITYSYTQYTAHCTSDRIGADDSPMLLLPTFKLTRVVFLSSALKIGCTPSSQRLFIRRLSSFSVPLFCRAWPMDTPPMASIRLLLRFRTVRLGQRPLISLPIALPVPSPSLLCDKSRSTCIAQKEALIHFQFINSIPTQSIHVTYDVHSLLL